MKIAYVTETWKPSVDGVVTRLENTLLHLGRMGHETLVVAPNARGLAPEPGVVTTPSVGLPFLAAGKPWGLPLTRRVTAAVREFEPDLVHVINPFVLGLAGVKAARALDLPLVASFHQDIAAVAAHYHVGFVAPFVWKHVRRQHATAARNLVTSRAMWTLLDAHGIERVALWPYGVDLDRFHPRRRSTAARRALVGTDDNVVAIYVGRLAPEKDLHHLVALAHAPGVSLVVVGDGPEREDLEAEMGGPNVHFVGWLGGDELADAYAAADVFVFPSTTETLGLVLMEAMASGLPVVAAKSDPSAEILGDGPAGVLLAPGDWDDLPSVVREVGAPGPGHDRRSATARAKAESWDWAGATEALVHLYDEIVSSTRPPGAGS